MKYKVRAATFSVSLLHTFQGSMLESKTTYRLVIRLKQKLQSFESQTEVEIPPFETRTSPSFRLPMATVFKVCTKIQPSKKSRPFSPSLPGVCMLRTSANMHEKNSPMLSNHCIFRIEKLLKPAMESYIINYGNDCIHMFQTC